MFDVSSINSVGAACTLAWVGHFRDHRRDNRSQVVEGIPCPSEYCPIAFNVLADNTVDRMTLICQVSKLSNRYRIRQVVLIGDRSIVAMARVDAGLPPAGMQWIIALHSGTNLNLVLKGGFAPDRFET